MTSMRRVCPGARPENVDLYENKVEDMIAYYESILLANAQQLMDLSMPCSSEGDPAGPTRSPTFHATPRSAQRFPYYRWECSSQDHTVWHSAPPARGHNLDCSSPESITTTRSTISSDMSPRPAYSLYTSSPPHSAGSTWSDLSDAMFDVEDEDSSAYQVQRICRAYRQDVNDPYLYDSQDTTSSSVCSWPPHSNGVNLNALSESFDDFWAVGLPTRKEFYDVTELQSSSPEVDAEPKLTNLFIQYKTANNERLAVSLTDMTNGAADDELRRLDIYSSQVMTKLIDKATHTLSKLLHEQVDRMEPMNTFGGIRQRLANSIRSFKLRKDQKQGLFQQPLRVVRTRSDYNTPLPVFVHCIMDLILQEVSNEQSVGLFRTAALKSRVDEARKECESLGANDLLPPSLCDAPSVPVLADVFKQYVREIPGQLVPRKVWKLFIKCMNCSRVRQDPGLMVETLRCCLMLLKVENRDAVLILLGFLNRLSQFSQTTLMSTENLVSVFLPTICRIVAEPGENAADFLKDCKGLASVLAFMITNVNLMSRLPMSVEKEVKLLDSSNGSVSSGNSSFKLSVRSNKSTRRSVPLSFVPVASPISGIITTILYGTRTEYRADVTLPCNTVDLFRYITECRRWDPTFVRYQHLKTLSEDLELVVAKSKFCPPDAQPVCLVRMATRHYVRFMRKHTFILMERQVPASVHNTDSPIFFHKLHFILKRIDQSHTNVTVVLSLEKLPPGLPDLTLHTCDILESLRREFQTRPIYC